MPSAITAPSRRSHATATSPLVEQPLTGNVYLVPSNHPLPDLLADLRGQVDVQVRGAISSSKAGGLRAAFTGLPDVPVTKFTLNMEGGKKGLLVNSKDLCKTRSRSAAECRPLMKENGWKRTRRRLSEKSAGMKRN